MARVLVIDDDRFLAETLGVLLEQAGYEARHAETGERALAMVRDEPIDLALLDLRLGAESGLTLLPRLKGERPEMSVIVITALAAIDTVVEAMKLGADNFVVKPIDPGRLLALVGKGLEAEALRRQNARLDRLSSRTPSVLFGESPAMRKAIELADAVAPRATTVLLRGETGSGKGMLARHVHDGSTRAARPFVELNCAGLQRELTESELFGHERGAFTGAAVRKLGLFEAADGGTLFLDEIGEMDLAVQAKLLKVLEQRSFRRVGGLSEISVDVRLIAATHRELQQEVSAGRFRGDLFYRLNVFAITLPSLRERPDDVLPLARRFLAELRGPNAAPSTLSEEAIAVLQAYRWPGNVRELRNVMERAAILCPPGAAVELDHLPPLETEESAAMPAAPTLQEAERRFFESALAANGGNIQATARALGVSRGLLYREISKYGLSTDGRG